MKTEVDADLFVATMKKRVDTFFAEATPADIEKLLKDTDYEFYRTITTDVSAWETVGSSITASSARYSFKFQPSGQVSDVFSHEWGPDDSVPLAA